MKDEQYQNQACERAIILGEYILESKSTVRACAEHFSKQFGISKSTVHKDISQKLPIICPSLYPQVKEILEQNKQERHIRGGLATKHKYEELAKITTK
ncbi:MAG: sporulation transcriptional regulator SpoIIID [Oscillospiraceae bacterium]